MSRLALVCALILSTATLAEARRGSVPQDPGLIKRIFGRGHPAQVSDALRQARGLSGAARDKALMGAFRAGLRQGNLSVYSARRLAKAMGNGSRDYSLRLFARYHQPTLTTKQAVSLAKTTYSHAGNNKLLERFAGARIKTGLSLGDTIKLSKATTYVGPANRILDAYKAQHDGNLTKSQLRKLGRSRAVAASSSSSSDDDGFMNVGGVNVGGINMGGMHTGGVKVGNMNVGGVSVGGTSFGGVSVGGINF